MSDSVTLPILSGLDSLPLGPSWLSAQRKQAAESLLASGLPTKKTEAWRFTPVRPITTTQFGVLATDYADAAIVAKVKAVTESVSGWVLPVVQGVPRFDLATDAPKNLSVRSIADTLGKDAPLLENTLGSAVDNSHFAALNSARFEDGVWIHADADADADAEVHEAIHIVHVSPEANELSINFPRVLITTGKNASLKLVENYVGSADEHAHLTNAVVEVLVAENSSVEHVRIHEDSAFHVSRVDVRQAQDSRYKSTVVTLGGALLRTDIRVMLEGKGAECDLQGAYHTRGQDHVDHHTLVEHRSAHCTSRQNYRGVLDDRSTAVFDGIVIVHRDAQKTEAHQENRNLLLSDKANVHTKPHLEIDVDDVICSHGATVGSLDKDQLFYMQARGIPETMARALLTYAFLESVIEKIEDPAIRARLEDTLIARLPQGEVIASLR